MKASILVACLTILVARVLGSTVGGVIGSVDGIQDGVIVGWACQIGIRKSIPVHLYLYRSYPTGRFSGEFPTGSNSETAVASACGTRGYNKHRFRIPVRAFHPGYLGAWRGGFLPKVFIYGIAQEGDFSNVLIANSGKFRVPSALRRW